MEVPGLGIGAGIGTPDQVGFDTYAQAEQNGLGRTVAVDNPTASPVTAYFFVNDGCPSGWCGDNEGVSLLRLSPRPVNTTTTAWGEIKTLFR
jgi:hypothetical protein